MPENSHLDPSLFDNVLSDFTDRLVNGQDIDLGETPESDQEMADLQETVRLLSRTMNAGPPDPAMASRIRANLAVEWQQTMKPITQRQTAQSQQAVGWWERIQGLFVGPPAQQHGRWRSPRRQQQGFSFALAGLTVFALVFILVFKLVPSVTTSGAVQDNSTAIAVGGVVIGIGLGIMALWTLRRKP
jgi:hypothetical protein